jgi:hypothetical protein
MLRALSRITLDAYGYTFSKPKIAAAKATNRPSAIRM